jgi:hypothetical protein
MSHSPGMQSVCLHAAGWMHRLHRLHRLQHAVCLQSVCRLQAAGGSAAGCLSAGNGKRCSMLSADSCLWAVGSSRACGRSRAGVCAVHCRERQALQHAASHCRPLQAAGFQAAGCRNAAPLEIFSRRKSRRRMPFMSRLLRFLRLRRHATWSARIVSVEHTANDANDARGDNGTMRERTAWKGNRNGVILWRGRSELDGGPVVAVACRRSKNTKTGAMVQVFILRADVGPVAAQRAGLDASVCGSCPLRRNGCYVKTFEAPDSVYLAYRRGSYRDARTWSDEALAAWSMGRPVRIGAYGDAAALPMALIQRIQRWASGWTAYTHSWARRPELAAVCMASVESERQRAAAHALGFRTFRIRRGAAPVAKGETVCPASPEGGKRAQCVDCMLCSGHGAGRVRDVVIIEHGGIDARRKIRAVLAAV